MEDVKYHYNVSNRRVLEKVVARQKGCLATCQKHGTLNPVFLCELVVLSFFHRLPDSARNPPFIDLFA